MRTAEIATAPIGASAVKRQCWINPVAWVAVRPGLGVGLLLWLFLFAAGLCRRARPGVKLERPQPHSGEDERA